MTSISSRVLGAHRENLIKKFEVQFVYGHREILTQYTGIDSRALLLGILQHGVGPTFTLYSDSPTPRYRGSRSTHWVYNSESMKNFKAMGEKNVFAIGAPWLYSKINDSYIVKELPVKDKYLVFPKHYSFTYLSQVKTDDIREKIQNWKSISGSNELVICLYWSEFLDVKWQSIALEEGVQLVCAGVPISTPSWSMPQSRLDFYRNLRTIIESASHCIFESFTSAIFYASDLGRNVGIFQTPSTIIEINREQSFIQENKWLLANVPRIFGECQDNNVLREISQILLGYQDLKSPEDLRAILKHKNVLNLSL